MCNVKNQNQNIQEEDKHLQIYKKYDDDGLLEKDIHKKSVDDVLLTNDMYHLSVHDDLLKKAIDLHQIPVDDDDNEDLSGKYIRVHQLETDFNQVAKVNNDHAIDSEYKVGQSLPENMNINISNRFPNSFEKSGFRTYTATFNPGRSNGMEACYTLRNKSKQVKSIQAIVIMSCKAILQGLNMEKTGLLLAKLMHSNNNLGKSLFDRFWIITPELFEEVSNNCNSSQKEQLGYIVFHPGDCRLFVQIPVLVKSFLGRKSQQNNPEIVGNYISIGIKESFVIQENLNNMWK